MNYFEYEQAIVQRIKQQVPEYKIVTDWTTLEDALTPKEGTPCCYVVFSGDQIIATGNSPMMEQSWAIVIVVKEASKQRQGTVAREAAGELISKTFCALNGFQPDKFSSGLELSEGITPEYFGGGMAAFYMTFTAKRPFV